MTIRYVKITMVVCLALFAFLVVFNNLSDFAANRPFVSHVLSMDTTFRDPAVAWRSIQTTGIWTGGYGLIIAGETVTFLLLSVAASRLFSTRNGRAADFERAKTFVHLGVLMAFLVWFFGFMTVGGEWFLMWQSAIWNGQQAAFRFYVTALLVLIYVNQSDLEPA